jgi:hypothetical protein
MVIRSNFGKLLSLYVLNNIDRIRIVSLVLTYEFAV